MQGSPPSVPISPNVPISRRSSEIPTFEKDLRSRDQICGVEICVLCGWMHDLEPCYIIPKSDNSNKWWQELQVRGYAPGITRTPETEPRNAILMCPTHRTMFEGFQAFVRYSPQTKAYIWLEFPLCQGLVGPKGEHRHLLVKSSRTLYHGKKLHLDPDHVLAPFYPLLLIHEWEARGQHPFDKQDTNLQAPEYSASLSELKAQLLDGDTGVPGNTDVAEEVMDLMGPSSDDMPM
ncbi:hypothetical protein DFH06DRAFT_1321822 [Mycena polygramma]|nr:hypothetical protein DFH06DRAFT_1321822 [Mycena polygramma]